MQTFLFKCVLWVALLCSHSSVIVTSSRKHGHIRAEEAQVDLSLVTSGAVISQDIMRPQSCVVVWNSTAPDPKPWRIPVIMSRICVIFFILIVVRHREPHVTRKKPQNFVPTQCGDRTHNVHTEATSPADSSPETSVPHATRPEKTVPIAGPRRHEKSGNLPQMNRC